MSSSKRSRFVNKRFSKVSEESHERDEDGSNKNKLRKRKLSDMLGPQWSKEELEHFYEAYRKYGKDWKKVAGVIRNRSADMVHALYNMNKAYLSLPEGIASVAGLTAMMTDHYHILEGSDSDHESNDGYGTPKKPQKRARRKFQLNSSKHVDKSPPDLLQHQSIASSYGCAALLKKRRTGGSRPRIVGKRTPRVPVMDDGKRFGALNKHNLSSEGDPDDEVAQAAALTLAEASQRGGSPQVSQTPSRRTDQTRSSPAQNGEKKVMYFGMDEGLEGSLGSREAENIESVKLASHRALQDTGSTGVPQAQHKMKIQGRKTKFQAPDTRLYDDVREECSCTEDGLSLKGDKDDHEAEVADRRSGKASPKKRSGQKFTKDENYALVALQTLADLSLNCMFPSVMESESSVQVKEEKGNVDVVDKPNTQEAASLGLQKERSRSSSKKKGNSSTHGVVGVSPRNVKSVKPSSPSVDPTVSTKRSDKTSSILKAKRKSLAGKNQEGRRSTSKAKRVNQGTPSAKQGKPVKTLERTSSNTDLGRTATDLGESAEQVCIVNQVGPPTKHRSRRKMDLQRNAVSKEIWPCDNVGSTAPADHVLASSKSDKSSHLVFDRVADLKDKLDHCLSSPKLRRWCMFEWFYSAIDYPWFARSEFVEYLNHVGLGHVPRLTRVEWGVIRSSLGKPRRLSQQFLQEERDKLEQYRESVRKHYAEVRTGVREVATDLARPLTVGQRVIACHPRTREIHDGSILTVDRNRCRVQFDRHDLGVEIVLDIDCMPLNPLDNMSEALRRKNVAVDGFKEELHEHKANVMAKEWKTAGPTKFSGSESLEPVDGPGHAAGPNHSMDTLLKQAKADSIDAIMQAKAAANEVSFAAQQAMYSQPCTLAQIQATEADIRALTDLTRALDKKEALLIELNHMNEEVSGNQRNESIRDSEHFRKQYAMVLLQLKDANEQVAAALRYLRQRNTYKDSSNIWVKPMSNTGVVPNSLGSDQPAFHSQDSGPHVSEIIDSARRKARIMVDAAMQAMSSIKDGEDAFSRVGEALELVNNNHSGHESGVAAARSSYLVADNLQCNSAHRDQTPIALVAPASNTTDSARSNSSDGSESQLLSELVSSCVASLLMIQTCTERQYPPAEVAQILDTAVTSLQPCCSENLVTYREIQQCMGMVKNQILALIPTQHSVPLPTELSTM
ncbi:ALWAYS EARLY 3 protein [Nymphaea thermarum]|nr:ALWAYS EARLY 3 protein [Nymphaea thermarum]